MKRSWTETGLVAGACLVGLLAARTASAADVVVAGSEEKRTYDCQGGNAVVNGGDNVLTLRNCATLTVNGADNKVDAGSPRVITVLGSGNKVTWTGSRPKIVNAGGDNVISSSGGSQAEVGGEGHTVSVAPGSVVIGGAGTSRVSASGGKGVTVLENGRHETLDCGGGPASIVGNNNALTLRNCAELSVTGNNNTIDAGSTPAIAVIGRSNQVTWTEGPGGAKPRVSNLGERNVVSRRP